MTATRPSATDPGKAVGRRFRRQLGRIGLILGCLPSLVGGVACASPLSTRADAICFVQRLDGELARARHVLADRLPLDRREEGHRIEALWQFAATGDQAASMAACRVAAMDLRDWWAKRVTDQARLRFLGQGLRAYGFDRSRCLGATWGRSRARDTCPVNQTPST